MEGLMIRKLMSSMICLILIATLAGVMPVTLQAMPSNPDQYPIVTPVENILYSPADVSGNLTGNAAPKITTFKPSKGGQGTLVTIKGANLSGATAVTIGGVAADNITLVSSTQITVQAGSGATGKISVSTPNGTATSSGKFTFYKVPVIDNFTPDKGGKGTSVTINGANLKGTQSVTLGGLKVTSFSVKSDSLITAKAGKGATGPLMITTPGGTTASSGNFTYYLAPKITSFTPDKGGTGSTITITGTNLGGVTSVKIGDIKAAWFTEQSSTQITAVVSYGAGGKISVITPGGTTISKSKFKWFAPPTISSFTPDTGGENTSITIQGTNLKGATSVTIGKTAAGNIKVISDSKIRTVVGTLASGKIIVTTPGGTAVSGDRYNDLPVTVSIGSPASVSENGTFDVNLNISEVIDLGAYQFDLTYDNSVIQIIGEAGGSGVTNGAIGSNEVPIDMWSYYENNTGTITHEPGTIRAVGHDFQGLYGEGYLAQVHFKAIGTAGQSSSLTLTNVICYDNDGNKMAVTRKDGSLTVSP
jgi:hypothetical protein